LNQAQANNTLKLTSAGLVGGHWRAHLLARPHSQLNVVFDGRVSMNEVQRAVLVVLVLAALPTVGFAATPSPVPSPTQFARCEELAQELYGRPSGPVPRGGVRQVKTVQPEYPELPPGTVGSGMALHALLVSPDGKVNEVWPVREPVFSPPFPAFGAAIVAALRRWEYEPLKVGGRAVPFCVAVKTNIHWR
jgi:hypothetical protein